MNKKLFLILMIGLSCDSVFAQFETADQLQIMIIPTITFDATSGTFTYQYGMSSSSSSSQLLDSIHLVTQDKTTRDGGSISAITQPSIPLWGKMAAFSSNIGAYTVTWYPKDKTIKSVDDTSRPPLGALQPGETLTGFNLSSSYLPGLTTFYAQGWVKPLTQEQVISALQKKFGPDVTDPTGPLLRQAGIPQAFPISQNSFHGTTLAPMQSPIGISSADLVDRLISLKHQSLSLGWISGPGSEGIVNSLDVKLSAAKDSITSGDNKTAANQLNAFINELDAQHGKSINDNAYFLLKANAQFIISKLAGP